MACPRETCSSDEAMTYSINIKSTREQALAYQGSEIFLIHHASAVTIKDQHFDAFLIPFRSGSTICCPLLKHERKSILRRLKS
jgi:hypothetical protein